jgi:hypothetical protein
MWKWYQINSHEDVKLPNNDCCSIRSTIMTIVNDSDREVASVSSQIYTSPVIPQLASQFVQI